MSLTVIPNWIVEAEINDGKITLSCVEDDIPALLKILRHNNLKSFSTYMQNGIDWKQWPRLGNATWMEIEKTEAAQRKR